MRYFKYIVGLMILIIGIQLIGGCATNTADKITDSNEEAIAERGNLLIYTDKRFEFSVAFPKEWNYEIESAWEASEDVEASPDGGIQIFVKNNPEDSIRVFGQVGKMGLPLNTYERKDFETSDGRSGNLYTEESNGRKDIWLLLEGDFKGPAVVIGASVKVSNECYDETREQIIEILKSIQA